MLCYQIQETRLQSSHWRMRSGHYERHLLTCKFVLPLFPLSSLTLLLSPSPLSPLSHDYRSESLTMVKEELRKKDKEILEKAYTYQKTLEQLEALKLAHHHTGSIGQSSDSIGMVSFFSFLLFFFACLFLFYFFYFLFPPCFLLSPRSSISSFL